VTTNDIGQRQVVDSRPWATPGHFQE
jgi:hypothetical protein